jgi:hypothetical protein
LAEGLVEQGGPGGQTVDIGRLNMAGPITIKFRAQVIHCYEKHIGLGIGYQVKKDQEQGCGIKGFHAYNIQPLTKRCKPGNGGSGPELLNKKKYMRLKNSIFNN